MYIEFGMAQKYVDDLSKNVKRGLKTKTENGWYPGVAPLGYLNCTNRLTGENTLIKDPERFPLIRRMWDLMLTGLYTPAHILEVANGDWGFKTQQSRKLGGKSLARCVLYRMFSQPFYYGWFEYPKGSGRFYQGKHEPMITKAEYDRVQTILGRSDSPRPKTEHDFAFTGMMFCGECGRTVTAEKKYQLVCSRCKNKFAYRKRSTCPRCSMPIEKMVNPLFLYYTYYHCSKSRKPALASLVFEMELHPFEDIIGGYYIDCAISSKQQQFNGEFHTPKNVCDLMARLTIGDMNFLPADGSITVCEPACGAGAMILSLAEACSPEVRRRLKVTAIDISKTACDMAFINTTLWGIPTRIIHGNALSMELWAAWSNIHYIAPWLPYAFRLETPEAQEQGQPPKPVEIESIQTALKQQEWVF
jgi:hypothetical protein